jgi:2-methylcitrate dehydratase PrpD
METTKDRILDLLGVALTGYKLGEHKHIFNVLGKGGKRESTIIGEAVQAPCNVATLINSSMANIFLTDGARMGGVHPAAAVIPSALAMAERESNKGEELILAVVLGYEAMIRVAAAMQPACVRRGFHPTSVTSSIGSVVAAGKLLRLTQVEMAHALSVAAALSAGFMAGFKAGDYLAEFQTARGAEAGVLAALLAQNGFKGHEEFFEEAYFRGYADKYSLDLVTEGLGNQFAISRTYIKRFWACGHLLPPIDATLALIEKYGIRAADVAEVNVYTYSVALETEIHNARTGKDAGFSAPFIISMLLLEGGILPETFRDEKVNDGRVQELMKKVHTQADPESDKNYPQKRVVTVEILTRDGRVLSQKVEGFRGEPESPLTREEIKGKFISLTSNVIGRPKVQQIINFIEGLERKKSVQKLGALLGSKKKERK